MSDLSELLKRVEAATGPDRELDAHLAVIAGLNMCFCDYEAGSYHGDCPPPGCGEPLGLHDERHSYPVQWQDDERLPAYTASIDAALALVEKVLPGWRRQIFEDRSGGWTARLVSPSSDVVSTDELKPPPTASLAILAALLRAKIAAESTP